MSDTSDFIKKMYPKIVLNHGQKKMIKNLENYEYLHYINRPARSSFMTTLQLAEFNRVCSETKKSIEWHAKDWVAMDRKHYEKLVSAASRNNIKIYYDEYSDTTEGANNAT